MTSTQPAKRHALRQVFDTNAPPRPATMIDGQTQLNAMFGAPQRLSKDPRPAPAPVVTPPGSRSKRKWAPANAIPPLSLPPLAKTPKKAVPPGWMRYGLAPALRVEINRVCSRRRRR